MKNLKDTLVESLNESINTSKTYVLSKLLNQNTREFREFCGAIADKVGDDLESDDIYYALKKGKLVDDPTPLCVDDFEMVNPDFDRGSEWLYCKKLDKYYVIDIPAWVDEKEAKKYV